MPLDSNHLHSCCCLHSPSRFRTPSGFCSPEGSGPSGVGLQWTVGRPRWSGGHLTRLQAALFLLESRFCFHNTSSRSSLSPLSISDRVRHGLLLNAFLHYISDTCSSQKIKIKRERTFIFWAECLRGLCHPQIHTLKACIQHTLNVTVWGL